MKKTLVGVLFGGRSVEHDISILSAKNIVENINRKKYEPILIGIDKKGRWFRTESVTKEIDKGEPLHLILDAANPRFSTNEQEFTIDVILPILHGTDGEDGAIQGMLQTMSLPYVGSGVLGSSVAMDKLLSKRLMESANLPVAAYFAFTQENKQLIDFEEVKDKLGLPLIIKPVNLGSSVGVSKVMEEEEFATAIEEAFRYDSTILIEEYIEGHEVECAILGNKHPIVSAAGEVNLSENYGFYSFEAKYEDPAAAQIQIPADLSDAIHERIKRISLKAYHELNCLDLARVDLFVKEDGAVFINEVNTLPGFTNISMYPSLMKNEGISYSDLITKLLELALVRDAANKRITTDYDSAL